MVRTSHEGEKQKQRESERERMEKREKEKRKRETSLALLSAKPSKLGLRSGLMSRASSPD